MNWDEELKNLKKWSFGNTPKMADELLELVLMGKKTATCGILVSYEEEKEPLPYVGYRSCVTDSARRPRCVVEVTSVELKSFKEVQEDFARLEGEGDLSYQYWKDVHTRYFKNARPDFDENFIVVCEKFKVLYRV